MRHAFKRGLNVLIGITSNKFLGLIVKHVTKQDVHLLRTLWIMIIRMLLQKIFHPIVHGD